jgi:hypothetical protein
MKIEEKPLITQITISVTTLTFVIFFILLLGFLSLGGINYFIWGLEAEYAFWYFFDLFHRFALWISISFVFAVLGTIVIFVFIRERKIVQ